MPSHPPPALVIVCGGPATGKTAAAAALAAALAAAGRNVAVVDDAGAGHVTPAEGHASAPAEKLLRGALRSAADRALASTPPPAAVIVDSLNHVKGFRYELWCAARAAGAAHAVVWCPRRAPARARPSSHGGWPDGLRAELAAREEPPDPRHRWDAPLFAAAVDGAPAPGGGGLAPPAAPPGARGADGVEPAYALDAVAAAVVAAVCGGGGGGGRARAADAAPAPPSALTPAISTAGARSAPADALADLDAVLQGVVNAVAAAQAAAAGGGGGAIDVPLPAAALALRLPRRLALAELRRAKRDYLRAVTAPLAGRPPAGAAAARGFGAWLERVAGE